VASLWSSKPIVELVAALQVQFAAIHREHAPAVPAGRAAERAVHLRRGLVEDVSEQIVRQLGSSLAERRRRDRCLGRQRHSVRSALVPERVEDVSVTASVAVADHEQQQHDEQVRRQLAVATEVVRVDPHA